MTAAPWGFENEATKKPWQTSKLFWIFCCIPACCIDSQDDRKAEMVNIYKDGDISVQNLIEDYDMESSSNAWCLRIFAFMLS